MKKSAKPNISSFEVEVENKLAMAYLFSAVAKVGKLNLAGLFVTPSFILTEINQSVNN